MAKRAGGSGITLVDSIVDDIRRRTQAPSGCSHHCNPNSDDVSEKRLTTRAVDCQTMQTNQSEAFHMALPIEPLQSSPVGDGNGKQQKRHFCRVITRATPSLGNQYTALAKPCLYCLAMLHESGSRRHLAELWQ